jgi:branched-chain amino acid transport system ATP-binding protein
VRRGVGYSPEGRRVFAQLSVLDNLKVGGMSRPPAELPARLARVYGYFPLLEERARQRAGNLSGGEQQMLAIGRALMSRPAVLMLDEPSLGLAPKLLESLYDLLAQLREEGTTILLVDQMAALALSVADRAYVLQSGTIRRSGTAHEVGQDPALMRAYLGDRGAVS